MVGQNFTRKKLKMQLVQIRKQLAATYRQILFTCQELQDIIFSLAVKEEKNLTCEENGVEKTTDLIVSDSAEFEEWNQEHIEKNECNANHEGAAGNMVSGAVLSMFKRSIDLHKVRYAYYIGDGDSKTYSTVINAKPYKKFEVHKKECVGHVQKRMGTCLRDLIKNTVEEQKTKDGKKIIRKKLLGGKGKLTGKLIDKLTVYYILAIKRNCESVENLRNAIWATYEHYSSTYEQPHHEKCPQGSESWCPWQRASAEKSLKKFKHDYKPFLDDDLAAIKPIYKELSSDKLLERCVGGFTQNNNESYNQLIWKITPKILPAGSKIVEIAAYTAACMFNRGTEALLAIMYSMGMKLGWHSHEYVFTFHLSRRRCPYHVAETPDNPPLDEAYVVPWPGLAVIPEIRQCYESIQSKSNDLLKKKLKEKGLTRSVEVLHNVERLWRNLVRTTNPQLDVPWLDEVDVQDIDNYEESSPVKKMKKTNSGEDDKKKLEKKESSDESVIPTIVSPGKNKKPSSTPKKPGDRNGKQGFRRKCGTRRKDCWMKTDPMDIISDEEIAETSSDEQESEGMRKLTPIEVEY
ncbi:hypothetical protein TKK_0008323 [Trichogramma kaykai]